MIAVILYLLKAGFIIWLITSAVKEGRLSLLGLLILVAAIWLWFFVFDDQRR